MRAIMTGRLAGETYHDFMNANFRRSGGMIYQPICAGCRSCQSLRVPVSTFKPSKSQRRCWRKNADLSVTVQSPAPTPQKYDLYCRYLAEWHERDDATSYSEFCDFLYASPVNTVEFEYRGPTGKLLGVGICDVSPESLSSVYFYFDPSERNRSLGTYAALRELEWAGGHQIHHYYLGYWVAGCAAMEYKASFQPNQILGTDGVWRNHSEFPADKPALDGLR